MKNKTRERIIKKTVHLFAFSGYEGFSMRNLAAEVKVASSVLYHYYSDKDLLLKTVFDKTNTDLGIARSLLPVTDSAGSMLKQRILFQLDHAEEIVFVLKYFLAKRILFPKIHNGYIPDKAYLHIEEVLRFGIRTGEFDISNINEDSKVITHAINGFILEYYPARLKLIEKQELANTIQHFILRALRKGGENYEKIISS